MDKYKEHIIEIRFKPSARVLDKRGEIAEKLVTPILNQWNISNNKIVLSSETDESYKAFFSFNNLGIKTIHPHDTSFFADNAHSFIQSAWDFFPSSEIIRIGVRTKILTKVKSFNETYNEYRKKFLALSEKEISTFEGELVDIGFPLNFVDGKNKFNVTTGPVLKEEYPQHFEKVDDEWPEAGFFVDVDYFGEDFSPNLRQKQVFEFLTQAIEKTEKVEKAITALVADDSKQ